VEHLWTHIKAHLKHRASFFDIVGKSREINHDIRKRILNLHKCGSSLCAISRCLKVPHSSVQTIICKYKKHGNGQGNHSESQRGKFFGAKCANQSQDNSK